MKIDYPKIKKFLHIGIFSFDLLIFIIVLFSTDSSKRDYKPYTGTTLFFLDLYIIIIYAVLIAITIFPKLYFILKKYILFIFTDKGKVIISFLISLIYWFAGNKPQFVLGIILTLTSILLLIYEFIFYFAKVETFLTNKGIQFENKDKPYFDVEVFEKDSKNISTPFSAKTPQSQSVPNDKQKESYGESEHKDNNPEIRDVEISNGYDNNNDKKEESNQNDNGFGF